MQRYHKGSSGNCHLGECRSFTDIARALIAQLDPNDPIITRDPRAARAVRAAAAQNYFRRHAAESNRIRRLHVADAAVEEAIRAALGPRRRSVVC